MHCVARQNKLETPKENDEVNKREVHECDVRTRDTVCTDIYFFKKNWRVLATYAGTPELRPMLSDELVQAQ